MFPTLVKNVNNSGMLLCFWNAYEMIILAIVHCSLLWTLYQQYICKILDGRGVILNPYLPEVNTSPIEISLMGQGSFVLLLKDPCRKTHLTTTFIFLAIDFLTDFSLIF